MTVAVVALFLALGGGAYAAVKLPSNSVGTAQLKRREPASQVGSTTAHIRAVDEACGADCLTVSVPNDQRTSASTPLGPTTPGAQANRAYRQTATDLDLVFREPLANHRGSLPS